MNTPCMYCYDTAERCAAEEPRGFVCDRATGHDGDHAACYGDDHPIATWPQRGETTGEVLARLQATLARLLDEADAELRDEADGGVAAALIEKEAENADPAVDYHAMWWKAERERENAERERDELRAALASEVARGNALQDALDAAPGALTAREHLDAAWEAAHVPEDGMIPAETEYMMRFRRSTYGIRKSGPEPVEAESAFSRRMVDPPAPARPDGAEEIEAVLREEWTFSDEDGGGDAFGDLAQRLASRGVRVVGEEDR